MRSRNAASGATDPSGQAESGTPDAGPVCDWLIGQALIATPVDRLLAGCSQRLAAAGIPILRGHISATTLHPKFEAVSFTWHRDAGLQSEGHQHGSGQRTIWQRSPLLPIARGDVDRVRHRLGDAAADETHPVLAEFRAAGGTDYVAFGTAFGVGGEVPAVVRTGTLSSWLTDRPGGFHDGQLAALARIQPPFAAAQRVALNMAIAQTVMATYLGADAGARVLDGEIRRGDVQVINAAIFYADLRGFTALSDRVDRAALVPMLDDYLERIADPVAARGGQVLKFLGDGLLATFALDGGDPAPVCAAALAAAAEALQGVRALNAGRSAAGRPVMDLDVALHLGDVLYGNVGTESRMEFTVIGPAVNAASRIEALCGDLDCNLLISGAFAAAAGGSGFRSLGRHALRGIREPQELFTAVTG